MMTVMGLVFFGLALIGMPLAFCLGYAAFVGLALSDVGFSMLPERMLHSVDSFPLMAIPLFMVAGELLVDGGMMRRLVDLADSAVGRVRGGLAHVTIGSAMVLSGVSGAAVADASALGTVLVPPMAKVYGRPFAAAVVAAAANLGPIIPPSNAMIVYAIMAGSSVSVAALFLAGFVPGTLLAIGMMMLSTVIARRRGYPLTGEPFSVRNLLRQVRRALVIVLMPVVVLGGMVVGAFTATEGAAIAVVYSLVVGFFVTRTLTLSKLPRALLDAAITSAVVGILIAFASTVTFLFTIDLVPQRLASLLTSITTDGFVFLVLVNLMLVVVGMFLESNAAYIMLVPLFAPIATTYGLDPLHFGFLFVLNLVIGMLTPPVGVLLFVLCGITGVRMGDLVRELWPFIVLQYGVLVLCLVFPWLVTAVPRMFGY